MADLTITATVGTFPSGASYNVQQFANAFAQRLILSIPSTNVVFGQLGGTEPTGALPGNGATSGLWWDGAAWRSWNTSSSKYLPISPIAGNYYNGTLYEATLICSNVASNTTLTLPTDKSGTIALTSDVPVLSGTQTLSGTSITLDWHQKQPAYLVLTGNATINHANQSDGQIQDLWLENNATSYTVTVNGTTWPNNTAPVMTTATATHRKIDRWRFYSQGGTATGAVTFGQVLNNKTGNSDYVGAAAAYDISTASDVTPPAVVSIIGVNKSAFITILFSKLLQGTTLSASDFIVKKAGVAQTVLTASVSSMAVVLQLSGLLDTTNAWTLQYVGSSVKDLAGNAVAAFGPSSITISNSSGAGSDGRGNQ